VGYTIPARRHPNPTTDKTVGFYSHILRKGNFHPDGNWCTRQLNKCNLIMQVVNCVKTGIHINCTKHKCTTSNEPNKQLSPTESITNDYLQYPLYKQAIKCIHSRPHNLRTSLLGYLNYITVYVLLYYIAFNQ